MLYWKPLASSDGADNPAGFHSLELRMSWRLYSPITPAAPSASLPGLILQREARLELTEAADLN